MCNIENNEQEIQKSECSRVSFMLFEIRKKVVETNKFMSEMLIRDRISEIS